MSELGEASKACVAKMTLRGKKTLSTWPVHLKDCVCPLLHCCDEHTFDFVCRSQEHEKKKEESG